jgi:hypothetical protein
MINVVNADEGYIHNIICGSVVTEMRDRLRILPKALFSNTKKKYDGICQITAILLNF